MDETLLQLVEQDVSTQLGTEEDGEGNDISSEGRYGEEVMVTRICVSTPKPRLCLYQPADFKHEALEWVKFQGRDRNAKVLKGTALLATLQPYLGIQPKKYISVLANQWDLKACWAQLETIVHNTSSQKKKLKARWFMPPYF